VATLGVGIGVALTVFGMAEAVLLRPLPVPEGDRLVQLYSSNPSKGFDRFSVSYPDFEDLAKRTDLFESASFWWNRQVDLSGADDPERVVVSEVQRGFFETLRSRALLGRLLVDDDQRPGASGTVVLSAEFWRRRFGSDSSVVGRTIRLDGLPYTVVGVIADGQEWPGSSQVWVPLRLGDGPPPAPSRTNHTWQVVARLAPGVTVPVASARVRELARAIYAQPEDARDAGTEALVVPLRPFGEERGPQLFTVLGAAVFFVLLIASLNQSGLLLTHALGRARELSLRSALGAGRTRIVSLLLGESLVLAAIGGVIGLALAMVVAPRLLSLAPAEIRDMVHLQLNTAMVTAALLVVVLASVLAGLLPALRGSRPAVAEALKEGGTQSSQGRAGRRIRRVLVVAELTLAVVLLAAAGLTIRSFRTQLSADPGFRADHLLAFSVRLPAARYGDAAARTDFYERARRRLAAIPGVQSVAATSRIPVGGPGLSLYRVFLFEGRPEPPAGPEYGASWIEVSPQFFATLGVTPLRGRTFTAEDRAGSVPVMILNATLAREMAEEGNLLGRRIRSWRDENVLREVVGVVPDIQLAGIAGRPEPTVFVPAAQSVRSSLAFLVRTVPEPLTLASEVRSAMREIDPDVALHRLETLDETHRADLAPVRFIMTLFATFGAIALLLALSGVYGLMALSVSQRTQEIGIRMAMGASVGSVRRRVLGEAATLTAVGLGIGLLLALAFSRVLSFALFGLGWFDPRTLAATAALLAGTALLAAWLPARRATRISAIDALRVE
jgi:predicted permease